MYFPELVFVQNTLCSAHSHRIRWQMMRDLTGEPADFAAAGRSRIANEGWAHACRSASDRQSINDEVWSASLGDERLRAWSPVQSSQRTTTRPWRFGSGRDATSAPTASRAARERRRQA